MVLMALNEFSYSLVALMNWAIEFAFELFQLTT
jgi:hypothetical protein